MQVQFMRYAIIAVILSIPICITAMTNRWLNQSRSRIDYWSNKMGLKHMARLMDGCRKSNDYKYRKNTAWAAKIEPVPRTQHNCPFSALNKGWYCECDPFVNKLLLLLMLQYWNVSVALNKGRYCECYPFVNKPPLHLSSQQWNTSILQYSSFIVVKSRGNNVKEFIANVEVSETAMSTVLGDYAIKY